LPPELLTLFGDLALDRLRLSRPTKFTFLCGGIIAGAETARPESLRDFLYRVKKAGSRLHLVLAESATQLYRDTDYHDLITFEEDIARIAAVVLVISESPGSLAELGAFAANDTIRRSLRVLVQSTFERAESFVRFGPIERMIKDARENVGFFPWRTHASNGRLVVRSAKPIHRDIEAFIRDHVDATPNTFSWDNSEEVRSFFVIYWIVYLAFAISPTLLQNCVQGLLPNISLREIRNRLFCMQLAGWIGHRAYGARDYYFVLHDVDVFEYAFRPDVGDHDSGRRKVAVAQAFRRIEELPRPIRTAALEARGAAAP
jgi:hypothetical protein